MAWEHVTVALACGCDGIGAWNDTYPEDMQACSTHGDTTVVRVSRVYESSNRHTVQLGTGVFSSEVVAEDAL